ncbi:MAG: nicotinamide mononucleotide transporter [Proteobacteria bacterium]|nr:nicotinamide mononucleotide transporter [Pseudomonadota bacterium]
MNWLDPLGAGLSLVCTYHFTQAKRSAWLLGMLAIAVNSILYWQKGIYGALLLEGIYFVTMIYGWFQWMSSHTATKVRPIGYLTLKQTIILCFASIASIYIISYLLALAGSDIPYWDAITTTLSLLAQLLLCLKIIHCWILWFFVDALMALMQLYKGLPFHSALYWTYLALAVLGYLRWRQIAQTTPSTT